MGLYLGQQLELVAVLSWATSSGRRRWPVCVVNYQLLPRIHLCNQVYHQFNLLKKSPYG